MSQHRCADIRTPWGRAHYRRDIMYWATYLAPQWTLEHFWLISQERWVYLCSWDSRRKNLGQGDTILEAIQMALCKQEGLHPKEAPRGD